MFDTLAHYYVRNKNKKQNIPDYAFYRDVKPALLNVRIVISTLCNTSPKQSTGDVLKQNPARTLGDQVVLRLPLVSYPYDSKMYGRDLNTKSAFPAVIQAITFSLSACPWAFSGLFSVIGAFQSHCHTSTLYHKYIRI